VKRWDEFSAWLNGSVEECVRANAVLAETRSRALAVRVAAKFADDAPLPALTVVSLGRPRAGAAPQDLDSRKAGIVQRG
jgi:hypothetical protein